MKNFYEMFSIINEKRKNYSFIHNDVVLGEDEDDEFYAIVDITHHHELGGEYEPESSEIEVNVNEFGNEALTFKNPGRNLEKVPSSMRAEGLHWLNSEIERHVDYTIKNFERMHENTSNSDESKFLKIYDHFNKNFPTMQQENPRAYEENFYVGAIASVLDELSETDKFWDFASPTLEGLKENYKMLRGRLFQKQYPEFYEMWLKEQN